jgi:hypothetical protein
MSVYVDRTRYRLGRMKTCHMMADTVEELHDMARKVGSKRDWFQVSHTGVPHYDLPIFRRIQAVQLGAIEISGKECAILQKRLRGLDANAKPTYDAGVKKELE